MAVWQENLKRMLSQKEVLILHGNVRDTAYLKPNGDLIKGFTELLRYLGTELGYQRAVFWGVYFDDQGIGHSPIWSLERIEFLDGTGNVQVRETHAENLELVVLGRWLEEEVRDIEQRTLFVINYIDKLTPYSPRGIYPKDIALLITMVEKIIENMAENNRLVMVALQDTMVPLEYYTNSPRVAVMEIPMPDLDERRKYFSRYLSAQKLPNDQIDFISNITDGLYLRDLDNILRSMLEEYKQTRELSYEMLRKIVNRYRIGAEEDPWLGLPLTGPPKGLIDSAEEWFKKRVIGQDYAVQQVVKAIKKARAGVVGLASGQASKPKAVFFFAGPTGVGKTFLAKKLAEYLFDSEEAFVRLDMSEFKEEHTVSKLIGSPPGYVGYERGGQLTNAVKNRPFSVVLFDEIEKAHPKIMDIFLQILDDGRLTDSRGQTVFFTESVIIFTSNIGTRTTDSRGQHVGERDALEAILASDMAPHEKEEAVRQHFTKAVQEFFMQEISRPELLNRIGANIIAFNYLSEDDVMRRIIEAKLADISSNFRDKFAQIGHRLRFSPEVTTYFLEKHGNSIARFGGRGLVNAIDDEVGHLLADQILYAEKNQLRDIAFVIDLNQGGQLRCYRES